MYNKIPDELKHLKQWVCWAGDKLPKNPYTGGNAQSNNSDTWSDYKTAIKSVKKYNFDGIGFMFDNKYFGVDLDKCIDNQDFLDEFVDTLQSYTEYSKSKQGIHIICKGTLPNGARRRGNVEMYSSGRYFIMTGNIYNENYTEIVDCTERIKVLHSKYLYSTTPKMAPKTIEKIDLSDTEIVDKARSCKTGHLFQLLYSGNWQGLYTSQSEADLSFCNHLAFWCQKDFNQIDRIFRSSGLMREKWNERRGNYTYGTNTINKAISNTIDVYEPKPNVDDTKLAIGMFGTQKPIITCQDYDLTDTGNANRFVDKYGQHLKYSFINKCWYYWSGKVWQEDITGEVKKLADEIIEDMKKQAYNTDDEELLKYSFKLSQSRAKENMIKESQHLDHIPILPSQMDSHTDFLNCQNGIVNLRNGELIQHEPSFYMSKISYSEYDISEDEPERWLKFLDEVTNGDKEIQRFLQKAVGYSLTGSIREQVMFFLYGIGNNGKSTFLDIIGDLLGTYSANVQPETIMIKRQENSVNSDVARLKNIRFVTSVEPNDGVRLNEGLVKQMTGDEKLTARFLYGKEFEFMPEFKIWIGTNHKPVIRGTDDGIWRRVRLIPFQVHIKNVDKTLKYKLRQELPQIFKWAVQGCILWQKEGLGYPTKIKTATEEYRNEMDILSNFCDVCINIDPNAQEKASDIYQSYSNWASENNEYKMTSSKFGREFKRKFADTQRTSDGIVYRGIKLTSFGKKLNKKQYDFDDFTQ